jgi:nucleoside-diphosphate-sugar epimerase
LIAARRVLVTGAGGFIGRASIDPLLAAGFEVHAVLSRDAAAAYSEAAAGGPAPGVPTSGRSTLQVRRADLLDRDSIVGLVETVRPSHLLHFAWIATPGIYWQSEANYRWLAASQQLVRSFHECGGVRAVMAGSCAEYDWSRVGVGVCDEATSPLARGAVAPYAECKIALQRWLDEYAAAHGLSSAWGRIFFQYGPGEPRTRLVASVIIALLGGREALCTHGRQIRSFLHVADVGSAFAALLGSEVRGAVNVGSADGFPIAQLLERVARQLGRQELLKLGAREAPAGEPALLLPNVSRLREEVGFEPQWTLDAGLADTVRWWKDTLAGAARAGTDGT